MQTSLSLISSCHQVRSECTLLLFQKGEFTIFQLQRLIELDVSVNVDGVTTFAFTSTSACDITVDVDCPDLPILDLAIDVLSLTAFLRDHPKVKIRFAASTGRFSSEAMELSDLVAAYRSNPTAWEGIRDDILSPSIRPQECYWIDSSVALYCQIDLRTVWVMNVVLRTGATVGWWDNSGERPPHIHQILISSGMSRTAPNGTGGEEVVSNFYNIKMAILRPGINQMAYTSD
jgi:hypothetical protein